VFVGRQPEMAQLTDSLKNALSGQGRLVMLVGEPGIGKTRTALELASHAEALGVQVLWGRCFEQEGAPPYWPWVQPIRSYVQKQCQSQLQMEMGPGAAAIAEIVPELREKLPNLESLPPRDPEQARFHLFNSITNFLKNAAKAQPLVLVLEDLHWADRSSLLLLEFLVQEIQSSHLLVLGTYRDVDVSRRHPLSETLGSLIREQHFLRVQLPGLAEQEVEQLIQRAGVVRPPPGLSANIHRRTEGNPLFVREIIGMLPADGLEGNQDYLTSIPEGVRDAIGRRLNRLSAGCNQVLTTASVVGREFNFRLLSALMDDLNETSLLGLVEEALEVHVIEEVSAGEERYQFSHALIQETLAGELSAARRVRLHSQIGQALEELYGANAEAHAAELAFHFAEAEPVIGPDKLTRYALLAGEQALSAYAWEEALAHFQRGLEAKGVTLTDTDAASDVEAADLLFGLGQAQEGTQDNIFSGSEVLACFHRAFDYYVGAGDAGRAVNIAAYYISSNIGAELITKALELVPPDSHDAGRLLSRYILALRADYERSQQAFHRGLAIAQQQQDLDLEMITLVSGACINFVECHFQESLDHNLRAIELAGRVDHPASEAHAHYDLTHVLYAMGDLEGAASHATAMLRSAERSGIRAWQTNAMEANENVSSAKGDWKIAREYTDQGLSVDPGHTNLLGSRALLEYQVGDFDAGEAYLERLLENIQRNQPEPSTPVTMATPWYVAPAVVIPVVAYITGVASRFDVAEAIAQRVVSSPYVQLGIRNAARMGLALMAVQRRDAVAASELYAALVSMRGTMFPQCPWGHALAADRILGLLSQTMENPDQAAGHFEAALTFCRKAGCRPELAWTCHDYADALLQRNEPEGREKAMCLLEESLVISTELSMRPLMEKVTVRQESLGRQPARIIQYPSNLTERQWDVLQLLARGNTNHEIAQALVLSDRTVQRHIADIYDKIGARNRSEATAFAMSQLHPAE